MYPFLPPEPGPHIVQVLGQPIMYVGHSFYVKNGKKDYEQRLKCIHRDFVRCVCSSSNWNEEMSRVNRKILPVYSFKYNMIGLIDFYLTYRPGGGMSWTLPSNQRWFENRCVSIRYNIRDQGYVPNKLVRSLALIPLETTIKKMPTEVVFDPRKLDTLSIVSQDDIDCITSGAYYSSNCE